ncbi:MAG: hypothetical protein WKG32_02605 [Gemmatimonadaceae bacterium]
MARALILMGSVLTFAMTRPARQPAEADPPVSLASAPAESNTQRRSSLATATPSVVATDCTTLFGDLISYLEAPNKTGIGAPTIALLHMTNYQAHGQNWGGWTVTQLALARPSAKLGLGQSTGIDVLGRPIRAHVQNLAGRGRRLISIRAQPGSGLGVSPPRPLQPFDATRPEDISYEITADGLLLLNGVYGPYQLVCGSDKFAYVDTGDSMETFSFTKADVR